MKRNLDTVMLDLHGKPYTAGTGDNPEKQTTLGDVCLIAFQSAARGDDAQTGPEKVALYKLASKIVKGGVVELEAEEVTLMKDRLAKTIQAMAYGQAAELLDKDYVEPTES